MVQCFHDSALFQNRLCKDLSNIIVLCTIDIVAEVDTFQDQFLAISNFKPNSSGLLILDIRMSTMNEFECKKDKRDGQ